jgi:uncharacterized membrane protein YfcA
MDYVWLCLAAVSAGIINSVAGGGTLLTYFALTNVVAPHIANATSTVALFPGSFASAWGYRQKLPACRRWLLWLTGPSLIGGAIGALLVEERTFRAVIPYVILTAALLFLLQPTIARVLKRQTEGMHEPSGKLLAGIVVMQLLIGVYGGYFGAGIGILMLSSLSFLGLEDIHHTNALKSFLAFSMSVVAAILFVVRDMVAWKYGLPMALAAIVGGYAGARMALLIKPVYVRWIVIMVGFALAGYYFWT